MKDQGSCTGGGYAFAAVSSVESYYLFNSEEIDLSEQQIIDCTVIERNLGCKTGSPSGALLYIRGYGISTET